MSASQHPDATPLRVPLPERTRARAPREALSVGGIPALPERLLTRSRLLDLVEEGVQGSLTLVSAPAGTGKTVLVSNWARTSRSDYPVIWLTTARDSGVELFWPRLLDALRHSGVQVAPGPPSDSSSPSEAWLSRVAAAIAAHPGPVVLVLDEGGAAHPAVHRNLATVIRSAGGRLRVVLLTRSDPVLPLNSYRLDNQLTEIRAADLAFDGEEAAQFFEMSGLSLTPAQIGTLLARTSGWTGGLVLAAMSLQGKADLGAAIAEFTGSQVSVSTYLAMEVLDGQPPFLRDILLRTSIVDVLSPGLFERLTGVANGQRAMAFMARGNSFIEAVPDFPGWYRYQALVREFLRVQLVVEQPHLVDELHREAADWFGHNGFLTMAVRHAASEGNWDDAARYLIDDLSIGSLVAGIWASGSDSTFAQMPRDERHSGPSIVRAALALGAGDQALCGHELANARSVLAADPASHAASAFSIAFLEALSAVDVESGLSLAHAAERQLRGNFPEAARARPELALLLAMCRARLCLWKGDLAGAADALAGPVVRETALSSWRLSVVALGLRGLVCAIMGHAGEAAQHAIAAEELARAAGMDVATLSWEVPAARAWVLVEEMNLVAAAEQVHLADAGASASSDVTGAINAGLVALVRARLLQAQGRSQAAHDVVSALDPRLTERLFEAAGRPDQAAGSSHGSAVRGRPTMNACDLLVVELTSRELEVLGHLAELLTNEQIAASMFISVNTVRTHVRSILRKLAVLRRNDAVRRAWELGLLPQNRPGEPGPTGSVATLGGPA